MALCKHIPLLINRDDIQELVGKYKRRIGKLIFDSYQALVEAVKIELMNKDWSKVNETLK